MEYSALIVTFNQKKALKRAIDSVLKQTVIPKEFIIIDNNSKDGTLELLLEYKRKYPFFRIFESKRNLGLCKAINLGVNLAKSPLIFNMDHDSELEMPNWIAIAFQHLQPPRVALVWGASNKGNFPRFKHAAFIGSAILFKKELYVQVGGFPEDFFIYDNELDLTVKYFMAGYYPSFVAQLDVKHGLPLPEHPAPGTKGKLYIYYDLSNRLFIYWKYYPVYFALLLSFLHFVRIMTYDAKYFNEFIEPMRGLARFFNYFSLNVCQARHRMPLAQFLTICYQQQFPISIYNFLKRIYK